MGLALSRRVFIFLADIRDRRKDRRMSCGKKKFHAISIPGVSGTRYPREFPKLRVMERDENTMPALSRKACVRYRSIIHQYGHFTLAKGRFDFEMSRSIVPMQTDRCCLNFIYIRIDELLFAYITTRVRIKETSYVIKPFLFF